MNKKLLVQDFLENHTFKELQEKHGVYASFSKSGHKWSLNYSMIESKETDLLASQCRGLILAAIDGQPLFCEITADGKRHYENISPGETIILGYGFDRFFNHGQGCAAEINWNDPNLAVLEKLDGTLCIVYWDLFKNPYGWCVATRSVPEADLLMDNGLFTFRTLFEKAAEDTLGYTFDQMTTELKENHTYCFELTTPYNRIVVNYPNNKITLLAARNVDTLEEVDPKCALIQSEIPIVEAHTYTTISELLDWVSSLNPLEHEGVVVRDSQFNRLKVKNAAYVAYNKLHDRLGTSERNCLEIILLEKDDDVAAFMPEEIVKNLQKIKVDVQNGIRLYDDWYGTIILAMKAINATDKKTFAISVQELAKHKKGLWQAPFFQLYDGKASSMKDFISKNKKDGTWGDSFLDKLLEISKKFAA